jgi:DNA-binding response OmpR family regulator
LLRHISISKKMIASAAGMTGMNHRSPWNPNPMRILIAETDPQLLADMKQTLEQAGYEVTVANNGMGAWPYIAGANPPDLLVTRLHLGPDSPPGTALGLHAHSRHPRIPVVYIPASAEIAKLADSEHGAILVKPFDMSELMAVIQGLVDP